jgi:hypothetical protein
MRIAFNMKIAPVISIADVSHNGLFIGLWTEAEVSLGFIVACSLCLPKLVQVEGKRVRNALSYASGPWSSFTSRSRKSGTWSSRKSTQIDLGGSKQLEVGRPMYYEERELIQRQARARLQPEKHQHDFYVIPSTAGNSEHTPSRYSASRYSQSTRSKRTSRDEDSALLAAVARPVFPRTQDIPVRLDPVDMTAEQLEEEAMTRQYFDFEYLTSLINSEPMRLDV